ncbi:hypothetical protein [Streptomyces variegatus]|uniref:hypothetical protein n=1 Tax=Streptomyces variegatus TaxID=284040 RepID=UPI003C2CD957
MKVKFPGAKNGAGTAGAKSMSIVGGMVAGADSIDDLDVLRRGGLAQLFGGVRAPSTLGSFLRAFTWGHVCQLESAVRTFTCNLASHTGLVPAGDEVAFVDIDSKVKLVRAGQAGRLVRLYQTARFALPDRHGQDLHLRSRDRGYLPAQGGGRLRQGSGEYVA